MIERLEDRLPLAAGDLDLSFGGGDGFVALDFDGQFDRAWSVAVQPGDGKIVIAGESLQAAPSQARFALARRNTDGTLDPSFGGGDGIVTEDLGAAFVGARDLAIQPDGKIVVVGEADGQGQGRDFAIVRYHADGLLDTSFGAGGIVYADFVPGSASSTDSAQAVAIDAQGRILVVGQGGPQLSVAIARLLSDGSVDTSFGGGDGQILTTLGFGQDVGLGIALHPSNDDFFVSASSQLFSGQYGQMVFRYQSDGTQPFNWGDRGVSGINTPLAGVPSTSHGILVDDQGRVIVAGSKSDRGFVGRIDPNGDPDSSFNGSGALEIIGAGQTVSLHDLVLLPDGDYLAVGQSLSVSGQLFLLARVTADGVLDTTFGPSGDGLVATDFGGADQAFGVALDAASNVIAVGGGFAVPGSDFVAARFEGAAVGPRDTDNDGALDANENGVDLGPTLGDGNDDGVPDRQQSDVASFVTPSGRYVTLELRDAAGNRFDPSAPHPRFALAGTTTVSESIELATTPVGVVTYEVQDLAAGQQVQVEVILPATESPIGGFKFGATDNDPVDHWSDFLFDGTFGAEANGNMVTLHLQDGGAGDADRIANGRIVDPLAVVTAGSGAGTAQLSGGVFIDGCRIIGSPAEVVTELRRIPAKTYDVVSMRIPSVAIGDVNNAALGEFPQLGNLYRH